MLLKYDLNISEFIQSPSHERFEKPELVVPQLSELNLQKGSVHETEKPKEKYALSLSYPGRYRLQFSFIQAPLYEKGIFAPNLDLVLDQAGNKTESYWLGDIDAAFNHFQFHKEINYMGHGRYMVDGILFDQSKGNLFLTVEAFDTQDSWAGYKLEFKDANPK